MPPGRFKLFNINIRRLKNDCRACLLYIPIPCIFNCTFPFVIIVFSKFGFELWFPQSLAQIEFLKSIRAVVLCSTELKSQKPMPIFHPDSVPTENLINGIWQFLRIFVPFGHSVRTSAPKLKNVGEVLDPSESHCEEHAAIGLDSRFSCAAGWWARRMLTNVLGTLTISFSPMSRG